MPSAHDGKYAHPESGHAYSCRPAGRSLLVLLEYALYLYTGDVET